MWGKQRRRPPESQATKKLRKCVWKPTTRSGSEWGWCWPCQSPSSGVAGAELERQQWTLQDHCLVPWPLWPCACPLPSPAQWNYTLKNMKPWESTSLPGHWMLVFFFFFFFLKKSFLSKKCSGISLVVQWLRRHAPNAGRLGSIPGMHMYSLLYLKWITNKDLLFSTGNCSMLCGSLDGRGVWGRVDICICMAESLR